MLAVVAFLAGSWLLLLRGNSPPAVGALDASWSAVLGWARAAGAQWGSDLAFTFGPLGFLAPGASYLPAMAERYWAGQMLLTLASCAVLAWVFWRLTGPLRVALVAVVWIGSPWMPGDVLWLATVAALPPMVASAQKHDPRLTVPTAVAAGAYVSLLALVKFSLFPLLVAYWVLAGALAWRGNRREGAFVLLAVPLTWLALWLAAGQSAGAIGAYLAQSLQLSAGYVAGMSMAATADLDWRAGGWFALASVIVAWLMFAGASTWPQRVPVLMALAVLAVAWKSLLTRVVPDKLVLIFPLLALVVLAACTVRRPGRTAATGVLLALAALLWALVISVPLSVWDSLHMHQAMNLRGNLERLLQPEQAIGALQRRWLDEAERNRLPNLRRQVGERPIDLVSHSQGVLLLNEFNYAPRPVFQGYAAYTPALTRLNEAHLLGPRAPDFVMIAVGGIDGHFFSTEDPLSLLALLGRYDLAAGEGGWALLAKSRRSPAALPMPDEAAWRTHPLGEFVDLPPRPEGQSTIAHLRVRLSPAGRLRAAALRESRLALEIRTAGGIVHPGGLVRPIAETGFLVDPLLVDTADLVRALAGYPETELTGDLTQIRVLPANVDEADDFQDQVQWTFSHRPLPAVPAASAGPGVVDLAYPGFTQPPVAQGGNIQLRSTPGERVLFMHSPAWLDFQLDAGTWQISAQAGILADVVSALDCSTADGVAVLFEASSHPPGSAPWGRLDIPVPKVDGSPGARASGQFTAVATLAEPARVRLRIDPGPAGHLLCDWAYVRDVRLIRVMPENAFGFELEG